MPNAKMNTADNSLPTSIIPWLSVQDAVTAIAFYKAAFSATEVYRLEEPEGGPVVRLSVNGAEFWVSESSNPADTSIQARNGNPVRMIITTANPDAMFSRALEAGASEIFPVGEDHGWRLGRLADPFGLHWEIGRPLI